MSVESRMDEFERVSNKQIKSDIKGRMEDFKEVDKSQTHTGKEKSSTLPYGLKRFRSCPHCDEFMEIHEVKDKQAIYHCPNCNRRISIDIE